MALRIITADERLAEANLQDHRGDLRAERQSARPRC